MRSVATEALRSLARHPGRTLLCAIGTAVAVGAFTATDGLTLSAANAVSSSFNELRATTVVLQGPSTLNDAGVARVTSLRGVISAGLVWDLKSQQPFRVAIGPSTTGATQAELPVTAMSPDALDTIGASLSSGRFYDSSAGRFHQMVALLGASAASELGIGSVFAQPAVNVAGVSLSILGIVRSSQLESQALQGLIVPPYVADVIAGNHSPRRVDVRTVPGAAQLIGRQGPTELDPWMPASVSAQVPPDPSTLRSQVQGSLSSLLSVLGYAGLGIGFLTITAVTMMSVAQRREEIGLRRAVGYGRGEIALLILLEAAGIGILGGILGASVGVLATCEISSASQWLPVLDPALLVFAPFIGVGVGGLAGAYPAVRAARITPISALRSQ